MEFSPPANSQRPRADPGEPVAALQALLYFRGAAGLLGFRQ